MRKIMLMTMSAAGLAMAGPALAQLPVVGGKADVTGTLTTPPLNTDIDTRLDTRVDARTGDTAIEADVAADLDLTTRQRATFATWQPRQRAAFATWPRDTRDYYWTLNADQQATFWLLADADKVKLSRAAPEAQASAWASLEAQLEAAGG